MATRPPKKRPTRRSRKRAPSVADRVEAVAEALLLGVVRHVSLIVRTTCRIGLAALRGIVRQPGASVVTAGLVVVMAAGVIYQRHVDRSSNAEVWTDSEVEALARVIRSEVGTRNIQQRLHVAWATRNLATERGQSVAQMACSPCGRQGPGRPVSSRQAAKDVDRILAQHVLDQPPQFDPTGGATHFINPALQDQLARSGRLPGYKGRTYVVVKRRWQKVYGWEPYYRLGPDLEMWGEPRKPRKRRRRARR